MYYELTLRKTKALLKYNCFPLAIYNIYFFVSDFSHEDQFGSTTVQPEQQWNNSLDGFEAVGTIFLTWF